MFDTIPRWLSKKTMQRLQKTAHYTAPCTPWGVQRNEIRAAFKLESPDR
jgi:hypothetical protein